jgi:hypothetical protein
MEILVLARIHNSALPDLLVIGHGNYSRRLVALVAAGRLAVLREMVVKAVGDLVAAVAAVAAVRRVAPVVSVPWEVPDSFSCPGGD